MKKKITDILNGIADGIFPNVKNSVSFTDEGREINRARLTASVMSWIILLAALSGKIKWKDLLDILSLIFSIQL